MASPVTPPKLTLDHVIVGVEDLRASAEALSVVVGRRPSWRGRHPSYGTANVLFRLDNAYLELLAPDPEATSDTAWTGSLGRFLKARGDGLFSVALQTADVHATTAAARAAGLPVEDPLPGSGVDLDTGATREWVNARIPPESTRGTRAFFIEHRSPAWALPTAQPQAGAGVASGIAGVIAISADADGARQMWREVFGLAEAPDEGRGWRYELGNANLFLRAGGDQRPGEQPDRWAALVVSTDSLDAASKRLREAGIAATAATEPGFEAVEVQVCGARLLLTEGK